MEKKFEIDFFEYSFLLEACIPPKPIARTMVWKKSIDEDYDKLTKQERTNLFKWLEDLCKSRIESLEDHCDLTDKYDINLIKMWLDRYNPANNYFITTKGNKKQKVNAFKHNGLYYIRTNTHIDPDYIGHIEPVG